MNIMFKNAGQGLFLWDSGSQPLVIHGLQNSSGFSEDQPPVCPILYSANCSVQI